jgi:hypothetical protein
MITFRPLRRFHADIQMLILVRSDLGDDLAADVAVRQPIQACLSYADHTLRTLRLRRRPQPYRRCRMAVHIAASQPNMSKKPPVGAEPSTGTSPVSPNQ